MKRLHEKLTMAAIILSCGFVMQGEPPKPQARIKVPAATPVQREMHPSATPLQKPAAPVAEKDGGTSGEVPR